MYRGYTVYRCTGNILYVHKEYTMYSEYAQSTLKVVHDAYEPQKNIVMTTSESPAA
jgi:hypothetical protein